LTRENPWWLKNYKSELQNLFGSEPYMAGRHQQNHHAAKPKLKSLTTTEIRWNKNEDART